MPKLVIIGAGVAGLSAGTYAQRNGYPTTLYESHYLPGGMCNAWRRKGYTFEGCLHYAQLHAPLRPHPAGRAGLYDDPRGRGRDGDEDSVHPAWARPFLHDRALGQGVRRADGRRWRQANRPGDLQSRRPNLPGRVMARR